MDIAAFEIVLDSLQYTINIYNIKAFVKSFTDSHIYYIYIYTNFTEITLSLGWKKGS